MADASSLPSCGNKVPGNSESYVATLSPEDKSRLKKKLVVPVSDKHEEFRSPYEVWDNEKVWDDSPALWPDVSYGDVYSYLINSPGPYTKEKLKAYKSLDAYEYFVSRKVGLVGSFIGKPCPKGYALIRTEVRPGQAESSKESHLAWVILKKSGEVITGHCDCKAGLGETCSHVAALLFKVEVGVRVGLTKTSCTSEACRWNRIFGNNSLTAPANEINFKPGKKSETKPRNPCPKTSRTPSACARGNEGYLDAYSGFLQQLHNICPSACVFKSLPRLDQEETDTANSQTDYSEDGDFACMSENEDTDSFEVIVQTGGDDKAAHPTVPTTPPDYPLLSTLIPKYTTAPPDLPLKYRQYARKLDLTYDEARKLQTETEKQADCPKWHEIKYPRLTSSNFGKICQKMESTRTKPALVARDLLQPKPPTSFVDRFLKWGNEHEDIAAQVYTGIEERKHCFLYKNGIFVSPEDSFLASTPDRLVYDHKAQYPWGLVEIKCPYSVRDKAPSEAAKTANKFMSKEEDGVLSLDTRHLYFYQVQGQMAITGAKWCDFVIYTKRGIAVERIQFDPQFWALASQRLASFFYKHFLPKYVAIQEGQQ